MVDETRSLRRSGVAAQSPNRVSSCRNRASRATMRTWMSGSVR